MNAGVKLKLMYRTARARVTNMHHRAGRPSSRTSTMPRSAPRKLKTRYSSRYKAQPVGHAIRTISSNQDIYSMTRSPERRNGRTSLFPLVITSSIMILVTRPVTFRRSVAAVVRPQTTTTCPSASAGSLIMPHSFLSRLSRSSVPLTSHSMSTSRLIPLSSWA